MERQKPGRSYAQIIEDQELEIAIRERFKAERFPDVTVDGEDPWDLDLFDSYEDGDCE